MPGSGIGPGRTYGLRAIGTLPADHEPGAIRDETVVFVKMRTNPVHQCSSVVSDGSARAAHEMELVVGMGDFPARRIVDAEM